MRKRVEGKLRNSRLSEYPLKISEAKLFYENCFFFEKINKVKKGVKNCIFIELIRNQKMKKFLRQFEFKGI